MEMKPIGSPAGTSPAERSAQPDTEPEEEQDAPLEHLMAVIDAAVDADAATADPLSGVLIASWASQCDSTESGKEGGTLRLRLLDSVMMFVTLLCAHPYPTGKRAPDPV